MQARELLRRLKTKQPPIILDVRTDNEFKGGHIPGAVHAPTWKITLGLAVLPRDKKSEIVVTCEHGPRAGMALGVLRMKGYENVSLLDGHMSAWRQAGAIQSFGEAGQPE